MGLPCLVLTLADNQRAVARAMAEEGVGEVLGWYEQVTPRRIAEGIESLFGNQRQREEMTAKGQRLVDGAGARRVVGSMLEY
jgi:spore coat polysaccharide biosynthesis predicted glycosyltransferase SpsG